VLTPVLHYLNKFIFEVNDMKKRLKFLLFIAAITVSGILLFQCYWVYQTYKTGEQNLNKLLTAILQRSIDHYQVQQVKLPTGLNDKSPHLDVMEWKTPVLSKTGQPSQKGTILKFNEVSVNADEIARVKLMIARLMSESEDKPVRLDLLKQLFAAELRKSNLQMSFKLSQLQHQPQLPENKIAGYVNFSKQSPIVEAETKDTSRLLLMQNVLPAAISLALILLSGGSLFYMWIIIRKQIKLDSIKNDFINNITHELRTPLSILKSTHEILINFGEVDDREKTVRYLKTNKGILEKLDKNVDRILDITLFESGARLAQTETVNISELITEIIGRFKFNGSVEITFINDNNLTQVITDVYIIDTVVTNLIDNAIKYTGPKAKITIKILDTGNGWQLMIGDNGNGIAQQHLPFIFDKFYRVPSGDLHDVKGYGLGLSYVRQLVGSLDGQITVYSKINEGTTFTIKFQKR
jgi:two-component system, OmpR family, phosphate regulon sensor histidine kinase PhoR